MTESGKFLSQKHLVRSMNLANLRLRLCFKAKLEVVEALGQVQEI